MNSHWNRALVAIAFAILAPLSVAQVITVTPSGSVTGGETVTVGFSDPSRAGQTITIYVSNGEPPPFDEEIEIKIELDVDGNGSAKWVADGGWEQAIFSGGEAARVTVQIN